MNWTTLYLKAKSWTKEAGLLIKESLTEELQISTKSNRSDLVTNMDKTIEQFFITRIKNEYPEHKILSEEGYGDAVEDEKGTIWLIDPIDGTMNFVHMKRHFSISVAVYHNGKGVVGIIYDVMQDEMFAALSGEGAFVNGALLPRLNEKQVEESIININPSWLISNQNLQPIVKQARGTRSIGSAAIEMAYIAADRTDGYISLRLAPWDFAAGKILVEEVGGVVTDLHGNELTLFNKQSVFVAKKNIHTYVLKHYLT